MSGQKHKIVVLCGPQLYHRQTCATLVARGLDVVGICVADQRAGGLPLQTVWRDVRRKGAGPTLSRVLARALYLVRNRGRDRHIFDARFDRGAIAAVLDGWKGEWHHTRRYDAPDTLAWLKRLAPDVLVVHAPYWVGKGVRSVPATGLVLGGHPGLTPDYRGAHSAFWAVARGKPDDVGCTVLVLDAGVDTGDVVAQERIPIGPGDSFMTLGWKGMRRIGELQADALVALDAGEPLPRRAVTATPDSQFDNPTLAEYLAYRRQRQVR